MPSVPSECTPGRLCLQLALLFTVDLLRRFSHSLCSSQIPGPQCWRAAWRCRPAESRVCWAAGHGAEPEGLAASLLESSSCREHRGAVLEQLTQEVLKGTSWRNKGRSVSLYLKISVLSLCRRIIVTTVHDCFVHRLDGYRRESGFLK